MPDQNTGSNNPLIKKPKQRKENILNSLYPSDKKAPPIPNAAACGYPTFNLGKWSQKLKNSVHPKEGITPLEEGAENLLSPLLEPCHQELLEEVTKSIEQIYDAPVFSAGSSGSFLHEGLHQKDKVSFILNELYEKEEKIFNATYKELLRKFDADENGFQTKFIKGLKSKDSTDESDPTPETAKKILINRLKQEQDRLNKQKNDLEKAILDGIGQIKHYWSKLYWAKVWNTMLEGNDEVKIGQLGEELNDEDLSTTFGRKQFSLFDAFFRGQMHCQAYIKEEVTENGRTFIKHTFDPRDPESCKAFIAYARAKNNGIDTKVNLKLGWGTSYETGPFNSMSPKNSKVLYKIAMEFQVAFLGFSKIPPKTVPLGETVDLFQPLDGKWIMDYFKRFHKLPKEVANLVVAPKIPEVNIANFYPKKEDQAELDRMEGIADAIGWCLTQQMELAAQTGQLPDGKTASIEKLGDVLQSGRTTKTQ